MIIILVSIHAVLYIQNTKYQTLGGKKCNATKRVHLAQIGLQLSEQEERIYSVNSPRMSLLSSSIGKTSYFIGKCIVRLCADNQREVKLTDDLSQYFVIHKNDLNYNKLL